jgi:hypothetical protein
VIIKSIQEEPESRRDWLLLLFRYHARFNKNNRLHQLWQRDNHPADKQYTCTAVSSGINTFASYAVFQTHP